MASGFCILFLYLFCKRKYKKSLNEESTNKCCSICEVELRLCNRSWVCSMNDVIVPFCFYARRYSKTVFFWIWIWIVSKQNKNNWKGVGCRIATSSCSWNSSIGTSMWLLVRVFVLFLFWLTIDEIFPRSSNSIDEEAIATLLEWYLRVCRVWQDIIDLPMH